MINILDKVLFGLFVLAAATNVCDSFDPNEPMPKEDFVVGYMKSVRDCIQQISGDADPRFSDPDTLGTPPADFAPIIRELPTETQEFLVTEAHQLKDLCGASETCNSAECSNSPGSYYRLMVATIRTVPEYKRLLQTLDTQDATQTNAAIVNATVNKMETVYEEYLRTAEPKPVTEAIIQAMKAVRNCAISGLAQDQLGFLTTSPEDFRVRIDKIPDNFRTLILALSSSLVANCGSTDRCKSDDCTAGTGADAQYNRLVYAIYLATQSTILDNLIDTVIDAAIDTNAAAVLSDDVREQAQVTIRDELWNYVTTCTALKDEGGTAANMYNRNFGILVAIRWSKQPPQLLALALLHARLMKKTCLVGTTCAGDLCRAAYKSAVSICLQRGGTGIADACSPSRAIDPLRNFGIGKEK